MSAMDHSRSPAMWLIDSNDATKTCITNDVPRIDLRRYHPKNLSLRSTAWEVFRMALFCGAVMFSRLKGSGTYTGSVANGFPLACCAQCFLFWVYFSWIFVYIRDQSQRLSWVSGLYLTSTWWLLYVQKCDRPLDESVSGELGNGAWNIDIAPFLFLTMY